MIRKDAQSWPPHKLVRKFHRRLLEFKQGLTKEVEIRSGSRMYRFRCETAREFNRCLKLFAKEPGTLEWITGELKPGQVFYDIGANIGVYSIFAARQLVPEGKVYAFEPHCANFSRLIDNILFNGLQQVVVPCSFALHDREGFAGFNYDVPDAGSSNSQLTAAPADEGICELKYATTVDRLVESGRVLPPHHVKIDVDGNEIMILRGMAALLESPQAPLTLQVEMNEPHSKNIHDFMKARRYSLSHTHYTRSAVRRMQDSSQPSDSGCNAIFRRFQE